MFGLLETFGIFGLISTLLALLYAYRAVQLAVTIYRQWTKLLEAPLTRYKKHIAEQASFFVAVPPSVFFHELGHALAVWGFGGQVVRFGYYFFWGFVQPDRVFPNAQQWFISLAGTLGSLLFGFVVWILLRQHRAASMRYFGLRAFRFQIIFSLVYYPLLSLVLPIGDWLTIYNFEATPILSGATAVFHALLLLLYWLAERNGRFETPSHINEQAEQAFSQLEEAVQQNPHNQNNQLAYIDLLRQGGAPRTANKQLQQFLAENPDSAEGNLQLAALQVENQQEIPPKAKESAQKALALGLTKPLQKAAAYQIIGRFYLDRGDGEQAEEQLAEAILAITASNGEVADQRLHARLLHLRSQAYRRQKKYEQAIDDIDKAIGIAEQTDNKQALSFYQSEKETIVTIAKRPLSQ
ncbi:MAG: hypothetical protein AAF614_20525 [Chloroflexota bacterium]